MVGDEVENPVDGRLAHLEGVQERLTNSALCLCKPIRIGRLQGRKVSLHSNKPCTAMRDELGRHADPPHLLNASE